MLRMGKLNKTICAFWAMIDNEKNCYTSKLRKGLFSVLGGEFIANRDLQALVLLRLKHTTPLLFESI